MIWFNFNQILACFMKIVNAVCEVVYDGIRYMSIQFDWYNFTVIL